MELTDFVGVASERIDRLAWFLGAGASQSAGLPTAWDMMWDLKRRFYCREENQSVAANDLQNPAIREKISQFLQTRNFPEPADPDEYSRCFEIAFGDDHRRQQEYISAMLADTRVSLTQGHRALAALIAMGLTKVVFTTNFDAVVEKAVAAVGGKSIVPFHLEGSYAVRDALNADAYPVLCKLHGDFRYQSLKNLASDLAAQNEQLAAGLKIACNRFGLVVAGYSGRDRSVMDALTAALKGENPFPHGLYWLTMKGRPVLPSVEAFLAAAEDKGVQAELVEIETFDSLLARLWKQIPDRDPELVARVGRADRVAVSIPVPATGSLNPLIRTNALPVKLPLRCLRLDLREIPDAKELERIESESRGTVSLIKADGAVWAWGAEPLIRKALGDNFQAATDVDISARLADYGHNLFLKPLIERSVAIALTRELPLTHRRWRNGSVLIVKDASEDQAKVLADTVASIHGVRALAGTVPDLMTVATDEHPEAQPVRWAEALELRLEEIGGVYWMLVKPQVWIWPNRHRRDAEAFLDTRVAKRFNNRTDALISAWIRLLLPSDQKNALHQLAPFGTPESAGMPQFGMMDRTTFSRRAAS